MARARGDRHMLTSLQLVSRLASARGAPGAEAIASCWCDDGRLPIVIDEVKTPTAVVALDHLLGECGPADAAAGAAFAGRPASAALAGAGCAIMPRSRSKTGAKKRERKRAFFPSVSLSAV